jgi:hypothetical protein
MPPPSAGKDARDDVDHAAHDSNDIDLEKCLLQELLDPGFIIAASHQCGVNANEVTDDDDNDSSISSSTVERPVHSVNITTAAHWEHADVSWFSSGTDGDDNNDIFSVACPNAIIPLLEDVPLLALMVEASGVNMDKTNAFEPIVALENKSDFDGGNEEIIKDENFSLDLLEDIFFQMFDQDGELEYFDDTRIGLLVNN